MRVSNADRVVFPDDGVTKGDVVDYYHGVADEMFPFLADRALTIERYPQGVGGDGFMQKNAPKHFGDDLISIHEVPKDGGLTRYPVAETPRAIAAFANFGVITFHVPNSTITDPSVLDTLVWDLDPTEGDVESVRQAALHLRRLLRRHGLVPLLMTSGSKGYHLRVRVPEGIHYEDAVLTTRGLSALATEEQPDLFTMAFRKDERHGRVFLDWMRNAPYATSVAPLSLRARPGAPVAAPIGWEAISEVAPDSVTIANHEAFVNWEQWRSPPPQLPDGLAGTVATRLEEKGITLEPFDRFRS